MTKEKVLIIGGGFGGVKAALELCDNQRFEVTLLTNRPDLRYYPSLHHTATGGSRASSSIPLETIFENKHVDIQLGEAANLDRKTKTITTTKGQTYTYDTLVLALGSVTNFFNIPGLEEYSYGIKSNHDAERLKRHLHQQLAENNCPDLHYVVVGGGPTGIELAGALKPYIKTIMKNHGIKKPCAINIVLVEAAPRLLPRLPKSASRAVGRQLRRQGVQILLNQKVEGETADSLMINGQPLTSHTVIWTAGVTNHPFFANNHFSLMPRGKVATDIYLQAEDDIFILGDNANTPYSGLAQTALYDGAFVAHNLIRRSEGKGFCAYKPKKPITVIVCGSKWAAVNRGKLGLYGWVGWLVREAADFTAFHEYMPLPKAITQWSSRFAKENDCPVCTTNSLKA